MAKPKRAKVTTAQEVRSLRRWTERAVAAAVLANERSARIEAKLAAVLDVQKLLLRQTERLMREKETMVRAIRDGVPVSFTPSTDAPMSFDVTQR